MDKKYCEKCNKEAETKIITKEEAYTVFGEKIKVEAKILTCAECNEELYCEELDNITLTNVKNEYNKRKKGKNKNDSIK